jgi:hypothetical protein
MVCVVSFTLHLKILASTVISDAPKTEKHILQNYGLNKKSVIFMFESVYICLTLFSRITSCVIK